MTATPSKGGKLAASPSHVYEPYTKQWLALEEDIAVDERSVISKLSAPSIRQTRPIGSIPPVGTLGTGLFATVGSNGEDTLS